MESQSVPLVSPEDWESLCCLCSSTHHQATLVEYLHGLTAEWQRYYAGCYAEFVTVLSLAARTSLTTGILMVSKEQYHYGAVLKVAIRDPKRWWCVLTRYVIVYMDAELNVSEIKRSSIEPHFADEFYHAQIKK
jgi:4-alpha-glucanotransferase